MVISLILPTFNNYKSLEEGLYKLTNHPKFIQFNLELIIVDDGSQDFNQIKSIASNYQAKLLRNQINQGKGSAIRLGVKNANSEYTVFTDSDMPFELDDIFNIFELLLTDTYDLVIADRTKNKSNEKQMSFSRKLTSSSFRRLSNFILKLNNYDNQSGLKGFKTSVAKILFKDTVVNRFAIDAEIIYRAIRLGMKIKSVSVSLSSNGHSSLRILRDGSNMLLDTFRIKFFSLNKIQDQIKASNSSKFICDDYGLHDSIDEAILDLGSAGHISGTSVMVTHLNDKKTHSLKLVKNLEIGLHINLTEGRPISPTKEISSLINKEGYFYSLDNFLLRIVTKKIRKSHLDKEIQAQLALFLQNFECIHHIDGHQHIQYIPKIYNSIESSLKQLQTSTNRIRLSYFKTNFFDLKKFCISSCAFVLRFKSSVNSMKYLYDYKQCIKRNNIKDSDYEYMLHVAHPNILGDDLNKTSFTWEDRIAQYEHRKSRGLV